MRIRDISISREHALLVAKQGHLYLSDLRSKFGSLLLCDREIHVLPSAPRVL